MSAGAWPAGAPARPVSGRGLGRADCSACVVEQHVEALRLVKHIAEAPLPLQRVSIGVVGCPAWRSQSAKHFLFGCAWLNPGEKLRVEDVDDALQLAILAY